jgi:hypothetical protein
MANTDFIVGSSNTSTDNIQTSILQGNGVPISLGDVRAEFNDVGFTAISEFFSADRDIPSKGSPISLSDFYGAENIHTWYFGGNPEDAAIGYPDGQLPGPSDFNTFTTAGGQTYRTYQTSNYDLLSNAVAQGWNGFSELVILIPADVIIYGTSVQNPTIKIDKATNNPNGGAAWVNPITVDSRGIILGKGGQGGGDGGSGQVGGDAIEVNAGRQNVNDPDSVLPLVRVLNAGFILAGGGGGGGSDVGSGGGGGGAAGGGNGRAYNGAGGTGTGAGAISGNEGNDANILRGANGGGNEPGAGGFAGGGGGGRRTRTKASTLYGGGGGGGRDWRQTATGGTGDNNGGGNGGAWGGDGSNGSETGGGGGWGQPGGDSTRSGGGRGGAGGQAVRVSGTDANVQVVDIGGVRLGSEL